MSIINKKILLLVALATITAISGTSARLNAQQRPVQSAPPIFPMKIGIPGGSVL
ncbi:MAG: hypothetical protein IKM17_05445 [Lentisphaeria bacterium]|nr:hypothetical protein [Lentisphaeria bacterium]